MMIVPDEYMHAAPHSAGPFAPMPPSYPSTRLDRLVDVRHMMVYDLLRNSDTKCLMVSLGSLSAATQSNMQRPRYVTWHSS